MPWKEARAFIRQASCIAARVTNGPPALVSPATTRRRVVFVHGFLAAGAVFDPLRRHIEERLGYATLDLTYAPSLRFESIAERVADRIASIPDGASVSLVGHSLGGLAARWYLQILGGSERADRLVTLATPHGGTRFYAPGHLGSVLRPGSLSLARLGRSAGVPHLSIVAARDRMVTPPSSAASVEDAHVAWLDVGHNEVLFDERAHRLVREALAES